MGRKPRIFFIFYILKRSTPKKFTVTKGCPLNFFSDFFDLIFCLQPTPVSSIYGSVNGDMIIVPVTIKDAALRIVIIQQSQNSPRGGGCTSSSTPHHPLSFPEIRHLNMEIFFRVKMRHFLPSLKS